ncbi:MAG: hypothetical protein R2747_00225 [Pyrinomonadaceae bacterium]
MSSHTKAVILARKLLSQAKKNEPDITADLREIATEISAELAGLENRFKTEISLVRKLTDRTEFNLESVHRVAEKINDVLRFTFILLFETYSLNFQQAIELLQKEGYRIPQKRIWNAWRTAGKRFDKGYRGINVTVISSQNQILSYNFIHQKVLA